MIIISCKFSIIPLLKTDVICTYLSFTPFHDEYLCIIIFCLLDKQYFLNSYMLIIIIYTHSYKMFYFGHLLCIKEKRICDDTKLFNKKNNEVMLTKMYNKSRICQQIFLLFILLLIHKKINYQNCIFVN